MHILNYSIDSFCKKMDLEPLGLDWDASGGRHCVHSLVSSVLLWLIFMVYSRFGSTRLLLLGRFRNVRLGGDGIVVGASRSSAIGILHTRRSWSVGLLGMIKKPSQRPHQERERNPRVSGHGSPQLFDRSRRSLKAFSRREPCLTYHHINKVKILI